MTIKAFLFNVSRCVGLLILVYIAFSIFCVGLSVYDDLHISQKLKDKFWQSKNKEDGQYVVAIVAPIRRGERNQAEMIRATLDKMGHLAYTYSVNDVDMKIFLPAKYINEILIAVLDYIFETDFRLAISFHVNLDLAEPKMMYISVPPDYFANKLNEDFPDAKNYRSFLDINLLNSPEDKLSPIFNRKIDGNYGIVGIPANKYQTSNRQELVLFGSLWGRKSDALYQSIRNLAKQDYMFFINHPYLLLGLDDQQKFTDDAPTITDLQQVLNKHGIALCIHSKFHNAAGIPSSRIFEIISSGAIAISDRNPFVVRYFGNNVLYFDHNLSAEEIYKQIDDHVNWVKNNPKKAEIMAKNAHQILQDKFTTEVFVRNLFYVYKKQINSLSIQ